MVPSAKAEKVNSRHGVHQSSDAQPDCEICSKILLCASRVDRTDKGIILGIAEDLLQGQCSHVALFQDWLRDRLTDNPLRARSLLTIENDNEEQQFIRFQLEFSPGNHWSYYVSKPIGLLRKLTTPDHPGVMRDVDPQWIDLDLLKQWMTACNTTHGVRCKELPWLKHIGVVRPKYLIDTMEMCIVEGQRVEETYIALSYQWGQTKTIRNTTELHGRLLKPNALSDWELARQIPRTVIDAFVLVKALGYRYLWVDALCVIQDDHVQLASELSRMHRIYHSADFTIVAADGFDANHGLRGLKGMTAAREHSQVPVQLSGSETVAIRHPSTAYTDSRDPNSYYTRAWTFQEFGFSLRRLVFADNAVEWHCERGRLREDTISVLPEPSDGQYFDGFRRPTVHRLLTDRMPTPQLLNNLVSAYNTRNLSFPEDALPAFAGIQSLLELFYQSGFLYGLPIFWFELVLCWIPDHDSVRRIASSSIHSTGTSYQLPSWSWVGWTGSIRFPSDDVYEDGLRHGDRFTEPVTKWYALTHPASLDRRPITSVWYEYRSRAVEGRLVALPPGWKQQAGVRRGSVYSHTRRPHENYAYPFPVPEPCSRNVSIFVPQTAYLSAHTSRAFLRGRSLHNEQYELMGDHHLWLKSSQDQTVGLLYLNNPEQKSLFKHTGGDSSSANPLELVAISKGTSQYLFSPERDWELELERWSKHYTGKIQATDCIYVLWVEWEDGVAYRRACGVVTAEAWEREREKELVDLILG
ncbi:heterokaryon incompatibility protein-domain-containing protein [Alternaria rosae]|uniref:heterokaryon incompatibility protein-domain-containing protein n=1 Tax=Alternaria rosae TaxID=1187941 RepID=UPI001E8CF3D5|nr:heterokaryon incompatibility protein-domain-containing protein [Alternaria rosae]KAH6851509.1 heterokaryon incompatibility protein-domain-containing protein [Alternaria rosae]